MGSAAIFYHTSEIDMFRAAVEQARWEFAASSCRQKLYSAYIEQPYLDKQNYWTMDAELPASLRPFLTRIADDEAILASHTRNIVDGRSVRVPVNIPSYSLNLGIGLLQLASSSSFEILSDMFYSHKGAIIQLSDDSCLFFRDLDNSTTYLNTRNNTELIPIGPTFESFVRVQRERDDFATCQLYLKQTSIPYGSDTLALIKENLRTILRFVTGLPLPNRILEEEYSRRLVLRPFGIDLDDIFSSDCLRNSFLRKDWERRGYLLLDGIQPSPREWLALEEIPFQCVKVYGPTVPWRFFQNTKSASVRIINPRTKLERPLGAASPTATALDLKCWHLSEAQEVDNFCRDWLTLSRNVVISDSIMTDEAWSHLWSSPALVQNTVWTSITISRQHINGQMLSHEHLDAIPVDRSWTISWNVCQNDDRKLGTLIVRRAVPVLSTQAFLRPELSPLLSDDPPSDAQQSVILSTMLQTQDDPDKAFKLLKAYCNVLRTPRTATARLQDLETSIIELRALSMGNQATFDMLMEVLNAQQLQYARDLHGLAEWAEDLMEQKVDQLEERLEQQQDEMRALAADHRCVVRLMERNRSLESRLVALEEQRDKGR